MSVHVPIQAITLSADTGSIEFTGIPQTFNDLVIVANFGVTGSGSTFNFQVGNGTIDTGSNYSNTNFYSGGVSGTTVVSDRASNATSFAISPSFGFNNTGISNSATFTFLNYANTLNNKTVLVRAGNGGGSNYPGTGAFMCLWRSSSSITNIKLNGASTSFKLGSTFTLYGIGVGSPKALGGNTIVSDGTYWYHAFQTSGVFQPSQDITADILVTAGGGGGGSAMGGGGGAGGVLAFSSQSLSKSIYSVTVGSGGTGAAQGSYGQGTQGNNSQFASLTASIGGGFGTGAGQLIAGGNGGSGGGGNGGGTRSGGSGTSGQGNNGANSLGDSRGGGGGGYASAGNAATGGTSATSVTNWGSLSNALTILKLGVSNSIAGGGGAGGNNNGANGAGGGGGATAGTSGNSNCSNATVNTGSGGGGGGNVPGVGGAAGAGGNGGSGIIIVRYSV